LDIGVLMVLTMTAFSTLILPMCNTYNIRNAGKKGWEKMGEAVRKLEGRSLVRRGGAGLVVRRVKGELVPETMRWGFNHSQYKLVNNARSDSLKRPQGMWAESFSERRCLVPISEFYEWQERPHGGKQPYEFRKPDGSWLWVAGLYERTDKGNNYATITTGPTPQVAEVHDRLLAIVEFEEGLAFLCGEKNDFTPYAGALDLRPCVSPLRKPPLQGELF